jgi:hypothetical protein
MRLMNLKEVFAAGGIVCAHIIDDAYDVEPTWQLDAEIQPFFDCASDGDLERAGEALGFDGTEDALRPELQFADSFEKLYIARDGFSESGRAALFGDFEKYREGKLVLLKPLLDLLEAEGVNCLKFGASYDLTDAALPQLLFVDLKLKENTSTFDHSDAVGVVKRLRLLHPNCRPFIFLMSSLELYLPQMREPFRDGAELFQSEFEAIEKEKFSDKEALTLLLSAYTRAMPQIGKLRESINQLEVSLSTASRNGIKGLRALDLADYFVLYHNTTNVEGTTVGSYIVELLLEFISHEIEGTDAIWQLYRGIEELNLQKLPRARFGMTMPATRLYSSNMLHSPKRLVAEEELKRGPRDGYFYLGDIFCEAQWFNAPSPVKAYAVITPACDIVRPESMIEGMLLCEGQVSELVSGEIPNVRDALPVVVMANPRGTGNQILITWDKSSIKIWDAKERAKFNRDDCHMIRIGRLRPVYALQLQHAVTSNLSRIGTQRPPSVLAPRQLRCYVASGGLRWKLLFKSVDKDDAAVAELASDGETFITYILSDPAINKIIENLKVWLANNASADKAGILLKLKGDVIFDALQGYRQKVPKPNAGKHDVTAYPLEDAFPDIGKVVAFIPSRAANTPFTAVRNASKCKRDRDTRLLFVFEDEPDALEPSDYVPQTAPAAGDLPAEPATGAGAEICQVADEQVAAQKVED